MIVHLRFAGFVDLFDNLQGGTTEVGCSFKHLGVSQGTRMASRLPHRVPRLLSLCMRALAKDNASLSSSNLLLVAFVSNYAQANQFLREERNSTITTSVYTTASIYY
jgi:hypothetical protein